MTEREIEEIKSGFRTVLREAKKKNTYVCDLCGNGTGKNGDGMAVGTVNPYHLTCFKCGFQGDIIEYWKRLHNCDFVTACKELADTMHITLEQNNSRRRTTEGKKANTAAQTSNYTPTAKTAVESRTEHDSDNIDYTEFYKNAMLRLTHPKTKGFIILPAEE